MSIVPLIDPAVPIVWQNAVVDVEPTSRYGLDRDLTSINSTICYANTSGAPLDVTLFAPSATESECNVRRQSIEKPVHQEAADLDRAAYQSAIAAFGSHSGAGILEEILAASVKHFVAPVQLDEGQQVVRFHTRIPIYSNSDGIMRFSISVPLGVTALSGGKPLSIIVLLPNDAPEFTVEVLDWSAKSDATVYGAGELQSVAGRPVVAWRWNNEPFATITYRYRPAQREFSLSEYTPG